MIDEGLLSEGVFTILSGLGVDANDENFKETPARVARAYHEICRGLEPLESPIKTFPTKYDGMVHFKDIKATGICPHHLLPIEYTIKFAYIPFKSVVGLSKIPRIIKHYCARPVLQEDLTTELVQKFNELLDPRGIGIVIEGTHGCMKYRGIREPSKVTTSSLTGGFFANVQTREEFLNL